MSDPSSRRLVIVRHAKSDWPMGVPDHDRPLGERGRSDAPLMGRRIAELAPRIDVALVSPAKRTQETWQLLAPSLDVAEVRFDDRIYRAWGSRLVELTRSLDPSVATAILVGHEPGVSQLVLQLADDTPRPGPSRADGQLRSIADKFPTCAVAVLDSDRAWSAFGRGAARLTAFVTPRQLR